MHARPSHISRFDWYVTLELQERRADLLDSFLDHGVPAIMLVPIRLLPRLLYGVEYSLKTQLWQDPVWVLQELEQAARNWLTD